MGRVREHVRGVIAAIEPHDSQARFEGLGVRVIRAPGRFTGPARLVAGDVEIDAVDGDHVLVALPKIADPESRGHPEILGF